MNARTTTILSCMFAAGLVLALPARGETIGTVMAVQGTVTIKRADAAAAEPAAVAMPVKRLDTIETGTDSRALIVFSDETELTLGDDSQTVLDEYIFDPATTNGNRARLSILRGAFLYASGLIGKAERPDVNIRVGYGTIGLRGTTVWGGELDQYGVFVLDGRVSVQTRRGSVLLNKGEGVDLAGPTAAPSTRRVWGEEKIARAVRTIALDDAEAIATRVTEEKERLRAARGEVTPPPAPVTEEAPPPVPPVPEENQGNNGFGDPDPQQQLDEAREAVQERREQQEQRNNALDD